MILDIYLHASKSVFYVLKLYCGRKVRVTLGFLDSRAKKPTSLGTSDDPNIHEGPTMDDQLLRGNDMVNFEMIGVSYSLH